MPSSSVHGILQAGVLEWVVISFSRGSSRARDRTRVSCTAGRFFTNRAPGGAVVKNPPADAGDAGKASSILDLGDTPPPPPPRQRVQSIGWQSRTRLSTAAPEPLTPTCPKPEPCVFGPDLGIPAFSPAAPPLAPPLHSLPGSLLFGTSLVQVLAVGFLKCFPSSLSVPTRLPLCSSADS